MMTRARRNVRVLAAVAALGVAALSITGCASQRSAEAADDSAATQPLEDGPLPVQGFLKPTQLCIENNSSMPVTVVWKNASLGNDGDGPVAQGDWVCGRGDSHGDYHDDVVALIAIDQRTTVAAAADNEAFQRPSVAIEDDTVGSYECFSQRAYLDMGTQADFRFGTRLDDGVAGFEMRRETLEASMKEMRVSIFDTVHPAPDVRSRKCDW